MLKSPMTKKKKRVRKLSQPSVYIILLPPLILIALAIKLHAKKTRGLYFGETSMLKTKKKN